MKTQAGKLQKSNAFSLIELLATVAAIGIIATIAIAGITNSSKSLKSSQLEQDVSRLNTAVSVFLSNGGSLHGVTTAQGRPVVMLVVHAKPALSGHAHTSFMGLLWISMS